MQLSFGFRELELFLIVHVAPTNPSLEPRTRFLSRHLQKDLAGAQPRASLQSRPGPVQSFSPTAAQSLSFREEGDASVAHEACQAVVGGYPPAAGAMRKAR